MELLIQIVTAASLLIAALALVFIAIQSRRFGQERSEGLTEHFSGLTEKDLNALKEQPEEYGLYRLETIFSEFKKALAVSQQQSARHAKERPKIAYGERSTYTIQSLDVNLKGRIIHLPDDTPSTSDIRVGFQGEPQEMSELKFTVSMVPPTQTVFSPAIFFAFRPECLSPNRELKINTGQQVEISLTACGEDGNFLFNHKFEAALYKSAGKGQVATADTQIGDIQVAFTDSQGKSILRFDEPDKEGTYRVHARLRDPNGEKIKEDDYYFEVGT